MGRTPGKYDLNGRLVAVDSFQGADLPYPWVNPGNAQSTGGEQWSYTDFTTVVKDEAGKVRSFNYDGMQRLTTVTEDGSGLALRDQLSIRSRRSTDVCFAAFSDAHLRIHDAAARLTSATNPENGTGRYWYDANGNLTQRTDALLIARMMTYDPLNRVTTKSYSDSTAPVTYCYDAPPVSPGVCNTTPASGFIDRLTEVFANGTQRDYLSFDSLGRVTSSRQVANHLALISTTGRTHWLR